MIYYKIMKTDTIAAIATGMTEAGIGIIRISGEDSIQVADKIFKSKSNKRLSHQKSHTMHFGMIFDDENTIDEVLVSVMIAPHSYTGENTVEINCHGGMFVINKVLETVLRNGARLAEPGEFTKRAFLNGKIDLSKAEAVMDLIQSKNDFAVKNSMNHLKGDVLEEVRSLRSDIIYEIAFIESALDDPEHISLEGYSEQLLEKTDKLLEKLNALKERSGNGRIRKDGVSTVIVGKPNAGKSSLLNLLAGEERAIVTDYAGTTRDILEETVKIADLVLKITDTAGIRNADDAVEKIGVERAKAYAMDADLILYMVDSSVPLNENDMEIMKMIQDKKVIVLLNKSDLQQEVSGEDIRAHFEKDVFIIPISAKQQTGMEEFSEALKKMFLSGQISLNEDIVITNLRQIREIEECIESLSLVRKSILDGMPEDFFSIDLQNAYLHLGYIIGEEVNDDLVNEIFSKFCMGK